MNRFDDDCDEQPVRDGSVNKSEQFGRLLCMLIIDFWRKALLCYGECSTAASWSN